MCPEVWMWVHQKYGIILIIRKFYSVESKNCTYLAIHSDVGMNQWKVITYYLQYTNGKIMITITIITALMSMHCLSV